MVTVFAYHVTDLDSKPKGFFFFFFFPFFFFFFFFFWSRNIEDKECQIYYHFFNMTRKIPRGILSPGTLYPGVECPPLAYLVLGDKIP